MQESKRGVPVRNPEGGRSKHASLSSKKGTSWDTEWAACPPPLHPLPTLPGLEGRPRELATKEARRDPRHTECQGYHGASGTSPPRHACPAQCSPQNAFSVPGLALSPASWPQRPLSGPTTLSWASCGPTKAPCSLSPHFSSSSSSREAAWVLSALPLAAAAPHRPTGVFGAQERESRCPPSPLLLLHTECLPSGAARSSLPRRHPELPSNSPAETEGGTRPQCS